MTRYRARTLSLLAAALGVAAILGGSLGMVSAGVRANLTAGVNPAVGGPLGGNVPPAAFVGCLPAGSWSAIYLWDGPNQRWRHYFNNVPAYVNSAEAGGLTTIPRLSGLVLIMNQAVNNPKLRDTAAEPC
jgi:hypothetical protein